MVASDWAVIPVAGRGTRMQPITRVLPKELLPLGRKPALHWIVDELILAGFRNLVFVTSAHKQVIQQYLQDPLVVAPLERQATETNPTAGPLRFFYAEQVEPRGLGDAVRCARSLLEDRPFAVALGDCVLGARRRSDVLIRMRDLAAAGRFELVVAFQQVARGAVNRYGIARPDHAGDTFALLDLVEKPDPAVAPSTLGVAGRYWLPGEIFAALESQPAGVGNEIQLTDAIRTLIRRGIPAAGVVLRDDEQRYDVGDFPSYFRAFAEFAAADPSGAGE